MFKVYFAKSDKNNKIYVGLTSKDPVIRVQEHNSGSTTWTRSNGPFKLVYYESYWCKRDALNREQYYITGYGKKVKKIIVEGLLNNLGH